MTQASITSRDEPQTFFTDRQHHRHRKPRRHGASARGFNNTGRLNQRHHGRCFVCKKEGFRSHNHPLKEREEEEKRFRERFEAKNQGRYDTRSSHYNQRFGETIRQYIINFEGDDEDSDEDFEEAFQAFAIDDDYEADPAPDDTDSKHIQTFLS